MELAISTLYLDSNLFSTPSGRIQIFRFGACRGQVRECSVNQPDTGFIVRVQGTAGKDTGGLFAAHGAE
jgi:hypothetical protein